MVSWNIALGLVAIAFILPFIFLHSKLEAQRRHILHDYSEKEHLRHSLRDMEQHVQKDKSLFLEALGVPFLLVRPSGRLVMANRAASRLLGIDASQQMNLLRMLPDNALREVIARAVQSESPCASLYKLKWQQEERFYRVTSTPLGNADRHIGIVFHDVTEEHRTQTIRREFMANASHELRTPLTIIRGYLETLIEEPDCAADEAMRTHSLNLMKKHADRIIRLVEDMLTVSRLENPDKGYLHMEEFDLAPVVDDVRLRLEGMIQQQQAQFSVEISPRPFMLHGDRFYWSQIMFNLMENALKNNPAPGLHVQVHACRDESGAPLISVEDNGVGIAAEALPFIFNRFYRADTTGKIKGTGLGLSIVKHAVEAHGGTIHAVSVPGERTCFTIRLQPEPPAPTAA